MYQDTFSNTPLLSADGTTSRHSYRYDQTLSSPIYHTITARHIYISED